MKQVNIRKASLRLRIASLGLALIMVATSITGCGIFSEDTKVEVPVADSSLIEEVTKPTATEIANQENTEDGTNSTRIPNQEITENEVISTKIPVSQAIDYSNRGDIVKTSSDVGDTLSTNENQSVTGGTSGNHSGGGQSTSTPIPTRPSTFPNESESHLTLDVTSLVLETGMSYTIGVDRTNKNLEWTCNNSTVVEVSQLGTVRALSAGESDIIVSDGSSFAMCHIDVKELNTSINCENLDLEVGQEFQLSLNNTNQIPKWSTSNDSVIDVDEQGFVTAVGIGKAIIYATIAEKVFVCNVRSFGEQSSDSNDFVTLSRGEYIYNLLICLGIDEFSNMENVSYYYADTQNSEYGEAAEMARRMGILPSDEDEQDVPIFREDDPVTREFAAMTAVNAAGFVYTSVDNLVCTDAESLSYPQHDALAIDQGFLRMKDDNKFAPGELLQYYEFEQLLEALQNLNSSLVVGEGSIEIIQYAPDVLGENFFEDDYSIVEQADGSYLVSIVSSEEIFAGNIIMLPASEEFVAGFALRVTEVRSRKDNLTTFVGVIPDDISEVATSIYFIGHPTIAMEETTEVVRDDEGQEYIMSYDPNAFIQDDEVSGYAYAMSANTYANHGGSITIPGKFTFDFGDGIKIGKNAKLSGKVEIEVPDITAKVDADFGLFSGVTVKEFTLSATEKTKVSGQIKYTVSQSHMTENVSGSKELKRIPLQLGYGLSADIVFSVYWDVNGRIGISYTLVTTEGFQFKDGNLRWIGNIEHDLQIPTLEASAEMGLKTALNLTFMEIWDLIGADLKLGPKIKGSFTEHPTLCLTCIDGAAYLSAKAELNPETLIGELLETYWHYTLEHDFWNEDNSPLRLHIHSENNYGLDDTGFHVVEKCTAKHGSLEGYVYDENNNRVANARIVITKDNLEFGRGYTNADGYYKIQNVPANEYLLTVSANGYNTFTINAKVEKDVSTWLDNIVLVNRGATGEGTLQGTVVNALTGQGLVKVDYVVFKNWNNTSNEDVVTRGSVAGNYSINLPAGYYTIVFSANNFVSIGYNISINENMTYSCNAALSPNTNHVNASTIRVVLTWGNSPRDLDSHMFGPNGSGGIFHTYYGNKKNSNKVALDRDDIDGYGPETTTVYSVEDTGKYSFYVHDFTNRNSNSSSAMSNSSAVVEVYVNDILYAKLNVPLNCGGTVWHIFDYNVESDEFQIFNTMYYSSDPGSLGTSTYALCESDSITVEEAIHSIVSCNEKDVNNLVSFKNDITDENSIEINQDENPLPTEVNEMERDSSEDSISQDENNNANVIEDSLDLEDENDSFSSDTQ